jgi:hypothetical protein
VTVQRSWEPGTERRPLSRGHDPTGVHALALWRQLAWAKDFALAGDLASALDALGDAGALARELGRDVDGAGFTGL